jgi:hypothetical protein
LKLDLLTKDIEDPYVRENITRIKRELESEQILSGFWRFFEVDVTQTGVKVPIKHNLSFVPKDIIILSKEGDHNLYFDYGSFDANNIYVTTQNPCRIRFLAGAYKDKAYGGSKKEFTFFSPTSSEGQGGPSWYSGAGNPASGLGDVGDFFLNTTDKAVYLKVSVGSWGLQGYLNELPAASTDQLLEVIPLTVLASTWTLVPLTTINKVADLAAFDNLNAEEVQIAWRKTSSGTQVEIYSKKANTFTVHVEGYKT